MNVAEIRDQLASALGEAELYVATYRHQPVAGFPAAVINVDSIIADTFQDDSYTLTVTVTVLVSKADVPDGWVKLDQLLSDDTIADALRTADCVATVGAYDQIGDDIEYDTGVHIGFTITVEVLA